MEAKGTRSTTPGRGRRPRGGSSRPAPWSGRPTLDLELGDLMRALEQDEGQKLGGKSAEAARFILKAIDRELDNA
jgi:hypothetical protein